MPELEDIIDNIKEESLEESLWKEGDMSPHYFVQVMADNGEVLRWEALTKEQADFIFKQEVEKNGAENCTTGLTSEEANCNWPHRW